jgi:hypothetical protein
MGRSLRAIFFRSMHDAGFPENDRQLAAVTLKLLANLTQLTIGARSAVYGGRFCLRRRDIPARLPQGPYWLR